MPTTIIEATERLSPYARSHKNELAFGVQDTPPFEETTVEKRKLNWCARCVRKLDSAESTAALVCRALLVIGLAISIVGIPFIVFWEKEKRLTEQEKKVHDKALETLNLKVRQFNKKAEIVENLGIQNFGRLPILNLQGRMGYRNIIDFLIPEDLSAPIMKGLDRYGRPFLAIKLMDRTHAHIFVATLLQEKLNEERWTWHSPNGYENLLSKMVNGSLMNPYYIGPGGEKRLRKMIEGRHPEFTLAR